MADLDEFMRWRQSMNGLLSEIQSNLQQTTMSWCSNNVSAQPVSKTSTTSVGDLIDPLSSVAAIFHCSNDDYEALREEIQSAIQSAVQRLEQQIDITSKSLINQINEREKQLDQSLSDRLYELVHGHRANQVQAETELRSEMASLKRHLDLHRTRSDEQTKVLAIQSNLCSEALTLAKRLELIYESNQGKQDQEHDQLRQSLQRIQFDRDQDVYKFKEIDEKLQSINRMRENVESGLNQLTKSMEEIKNEVLLAETRSQRKFVEIGADLVEMHELVESQVQETRSLLDTVQKSQKQLLDQCSNTSTQIADARVQIAVNTLSNGIDRLNRDLHEQRIDRERVQREVRTEIEYLQQMLNNKCETRIVSGIYDQISEIQKQIHQINNNERQCNDRHEHHDQDYKSISQQCVDLQQQIQSKSDLIQARTELRIDDLDRKCAQMQQELKSDYEQQLEQVCALKRSLSIWTDVKLYDSVIESICTRTLERYEIEPGFRSIIEESVARITDRNQSDFHTMADQIDRELRACSNQFESRCAELAGLFEAHRLRNDSDLENVRKQHENVSNNMRLWLETCQRDTVQMMTKAISDQGEAIQIQMQIDREQIHSDYDHMNDLIAKNADMIMSLGKNHLEEVAKRKEIIKQIASMKSILVELQPESLSGRSETATMERSIHHFAAEADHVSTRRQLDPSKVENEYRQPSSIDHEQQEIRYKDTDSDDDQRVIPNFALGDDDDQFSLIQDFAVNSNKEDEVLNQLQSEESDLNLFTDED